jgi:hypothetical protein
MTWSQAIKAFLIALPQLVEIIKPTLDFFNSFIKDKPEKKATELGAMIRELADSIEIEDLAEKKKARREVLKKLADFVESN